MVQQSLLFYWDYVKAPLKLSKVPNVAEVVDIVAFCEILTPKLVEGVLRNLLIEPALFQYCKYRKGRAI